MLGERGTTLFVQEKARFHCLLVHGFKNLTEVTFQPKQLSSKLVLAILTHKNTLKTVVTAVPSQSLFHSTIVPTLQSNLPEHNWISFTHCVLRNLSSPFHEVQMIFVMVVLVMVIVLSFKRSSQPPLPCLLKSKVAADPTSSAWTVDSSQKKVDKD
jgi:hypothetical protein